MTKLQKIVLGIVAVITVMLLCLAIAPSDSKVGGVYQQVSKTFFDGINVGTGNQFSVSSAGALTTSGAITASGGLTATGSLVLGSTSAGLKYYESVVTPTADATLTAAQSGTTFNIGTAGVDLTLPAVASSAGVHYKFVISAAYATTNITVVSAEGDNIEGSLVVAGAVVDCDANDVITSVADGENIGDFFELFSNGTYWYVGASGALTASKLTCSG